MFIIIAFKKSFKIVTLVLKVKNHFDIMGVKR